jgi:protocatechuate 3,4-dioxygenase beta subunit
MGLAAAWELQRAAWAIGLGQETAVCSTVAAEQEVGPYYVANELLRADIREGKPGVPILLRLAVLDARSCTPLQGAAIDVWHCDALGLYAGYTKINPRGFGPGVSPPGFDPSHRRPQGPPPGFDPSHPDNHPGPPEGMGPPSPIEQTDQLTFLRGIQFTNTRGRLEFATIFPGFYMGRTNHIHFKVREGGRVVRRGDSEGKTYMEGHTCHTGQVFFPEELAAELMQQEPYSRHRINRTTQAEDMIFNGQHGGPSISRLRPLDAKRPEAGYISELIVAVDPSATPAPVGPGGPRGSRRPQASSGENCAPELFSRRREG